MPLLARDLMQANPLTIAAGTPLLEVQHLFVTAEIGSAPVLDEGGAIIGLISSNDLLRASDQALDEDLDEGEAESASRLDALGELTARDAATSEVRWVAPTTPVAEVAALMRAEGLRRVLVGDDHQLAGILTTFDLLGAITP